MPITLSRRVARFNKRINNPIQRQYAWLLPPWAMVIHRGRKSGKLYRTPVNAYRKGNTFAVAMLYGDRTDWVRNLIAAGEGQVVRGGRTYELRSPRVVDAAEAGKDVPAAARAIGRTSGKLFVGELGERRPAFGRGPRAGRG